ncbi:nuclear transport factor 2 family protein [uncultured Mucilaginibacter sp.]|uniref:nuclear transport factor 2 family protein n=1 Tax=uncultured Mucilaginibacter sp. TaxID=797541 RepID=UPI002617C37F|nr:nuclear transport factor 2 family protein [uncultured Mucilaginibacter sp.]
MNNPQTIKEAIMLYTQAWNEKEPINIKAKIERCWADDATYVDAQNPLVKGIDGITNLITRSYGQLPIRTFGLPAQPEYHNQSGRFRWTLVQPEQEDQEGMDYFEYNEANLITRIVGFPGALA